MRGDHQASLANSKSDDHRSKPRQVHDDKERISVSLRLNERPRCLCTYKVDMYLLPGLADALRELQLMAKDVIVVTDDGLRVSRRAHVTSRGVLHSRCWYFRRWAGNRPIWFPLGRNFHTAVKKARQIEFALREMRLPMAEVQARYGTKRRAETPEGGATIGQIIDFLEAHGESLELGERTVAGYIRCLLNVVQVGRAFQTGKTMTEAEARMLPLAALDHALASDFKKALEGRETDELALARLKRTINSKLRSAKAVFSPRLRDEYASARFDVPDMSSFLSVSLYRRVTKRFTLPPRELITSVMVQINRRASVFDRNTWLTCVLACHAGLRRAEIASARWRWLSDDGSPHIRVQPEADFVPKSGRDRVVPLHPIVYRALVDEKITGDEYLLTGTEGMRTDVHMRKCTQVLHGFGVAAAKPIHELRKWFGSYVANVFGLTTAQRYLGHSSHQTTLDYYADLNFDDSLRGLWAGDCMNSGRSWSEVNGME